MAWGKRGNSLAVGWVMAMLACAGNVVRGVWGFWEGETSVSVGSRFGRGHEPRITSRGDEARVYAVARVAIAAGIGIAAAIAFVKSRTVEPDWLPGFDVWKPAEARPRVLLSAGVAGGLVASGELVIAAWEICQQSARVGAGPYVYSYIVSGTEAILRGVVDGTSGIFWGIVTIVAFGGVVLRNVSARILAVLLATDLIVWCSAASWIGVLRFARGREHFSFAGYYGGVMAAANILNDFIWVAAWLVAAGGLFLLARHGVESRAKRLGKAAIALGVAYGLGALGLAGAGLVRAAFF